MTGAKIDTSDYVVTTKVALKPHRIADVITAGVEGGISYWATGFLLNEPSGLDSGDGDPWYAKGVFYARDSFKIEVRQAEEHVAGAGLKLFITKPDIQQALQIMADKYPWHWENIVKENEDAETGDVLIQLAAFKEIVYG